ncbi:helix-turn-helix domain-containing protein [Sphaerotilus sp.]|uniref:helix-turn-helix transcriptional regulator n=1 Tax=Sphaerotilus sp. TaxID=2093942 RepID=UPI00286DB42D|nr:helix-turn-helix domain-containing protein [Sphaerotilus sp.]
MSIKNQEVPTTDTLLSVEQTRAKAGGIGRSTVYKLIQSGHLTVVKIGRLTRFRASEVERLIQSGTTA